MQFIGRVGATIVVGAAVACAFSTAASTQVRTFGPATPYLVTGRSVSVPPYHQVGQQLSGESGQKDQMRPDDSGRPEPASSDQSAPK
jgi:hypothetical protein